MTKFTKTVSCIMMASLILFIVFANAFTSNATITLTENQVKAPIEKYIAESLKKYDTRTKSTISFNNIVDNNSSFYQYAKQLTTLTNNRYKSFQSLKLDKVNYYIEYTSFKKCKNSYNIEANVYEEKKYSDSNIPGYVCTKHKFTLKSLKNKAIIVNDVTNSVEEQYLQHNSKSDRMVVSKAISTDNINIQNELKRSKALSFNNKSNNHNLIIKKVNKSNFGLLSKESSNYSNNNYTTTESTNTTFKKGKYHKYNFNFNKMYQYAEKYNASSPKKKANRNTNYANFDNMGGDCTNYVSQILRAGGAPLDTTGNYQWYYHKVTDRSPSWTGVNQLYNYLIHNDYVGPQGSIIKYDQPYVASKGDIIQVKFNGKKTFTHSLWITRHQTGTTSCTRIACHSNDRWEDKLDSIPGSKRWIKLKGYGKIS